MCVAPSFLFLSLWTCSSRPFPWPSVPLLPLPALCVLLSCYLDRMLYVLLQRYVNCSTFSKCLPSISNFPVGSFSLNTIIFVISKFILRPSVSLALPIQCPCCFFQSLSVFFYHSGAQRPAR